MHTAVLLGIIIVLLLCVHEINLPSSPSCPAPFSPYMGLPAQGCSSLATHCYTALATALYILPSRAPDVLCINQCST